jgi:hypothetical protein
MCWRCVSDSVPYIVGALGFVKLYAIRMTRDGSGDGEPGAHEELTHAPFSAPDGRAGDSLGPANP